MSSVDDEGPSTLGGFIDAVPAADATLAVLNRTGPQPLVDLLRETFGPSTVTVEERHDPAREADEVVLVRDGAVVASSTMAELQNALLLVNSDRYRTGAHGLTEAEMPAVLTGLDEVEFEVRGYPMSNKEKLLLILISRFIEGAALRRGAGRFDASFQRLSRFDDEYGTRAVYDRLCDTDVDVHVYGVPDRRDAIDLPLTVHTGTHEEYRRSWFVAFRPPPGEEGHIALVALETGDNVWRAMWTYDPDRVNRIGEYVEQSF